MKGKIDSKVMKRGCLLMTVSFLWFLKPGGTCNIEKMITDKI